jgi:uncharacterized protein YegP (UPF0339 family)
MPRSGTGLSRGVTRGVKVHVFKGKDGDWYWSTVAGNGEIVADSAEGYVDRSYCVKKAVERNPDAELVIDE